MSEEQGRKGYTAINGVLHRKVNLVTLYNKDAVQVAYLSI